ncbi:hypothetical protein ScPMuIL_016110 [Solemya velum]
MASGGTLEDDSSQVLELTEYLKNFETKLTSQEQTLASLLQELKIETNKVRDLKSSLDEKYAYKDGKLGTTAMRTEIPNFQGKGNAQAEREFDSFQRRIEIFKHRIERDLSKWKRPVAEETRTSQWCVGYLKQKLASTENRDKQNRINVYLEKLEKTQALVCISTRVRNHQMIERNIRAELKIIRRQGLSLSQRYGEEEEDSSALVSLLAN